MARIPCGIESWRYPAVFEKTSTAKRASAVSAALLQVREAGKTAPAIARNGISCRVGRRLTERGRRSTLRVSKNEPREMAMKWKTPVIIEIAVGLEINAYACAEVK